MSDVSVIREGEVRLRHPDGRGVTAGVYGANDFSKVVFYSHGFPASRLEASVAHQAASALGVTIVAIDRPGFGGSDWYAERRFEDWAGDVALVADHFGVKRFSIMGVSGGTPTAIAAAAKLGDRVNSLTVVSGISPIVERGSLTGMNAANRFLLRVAQVFPALGRISISVIAHLWRTVPIVAKVWFGVLLPPPDRAIVTRREVGLMLARNIREALRQGVRGTVAEFMLFTSDWRPLLREVRVPTTIWHGDADTYVPLAMGDILQKGISGSTLHKVKGGGHFMIIDTLPMILTRFAQV